MSWSFYKRVESVRLCVGGKDTSSQPPAYAPLQPRRALYCSGSPPPWCWPALPTLSWPASTRTLQPPPTPPPCARRRRTCRTQAAPPYEAPGSARPSLLSGRVHGDRPCPKPDRCASQRRLPRSPPASPARGVVVCSATDLLRCQTGPPPTRRVGVRAPARPLPQPRCGGPSPPALLPRPPTPPLLLCSPASPWPLPGAVSPLGNPAAA